MNTIKYTDAFTENVNGQLKAHFHHDADGNPLVETDTKGVKHYTIDLTLGSPIAQKIDSVKYYMDDKTYWDPVAVSKDRDNEFREQISSYGDFEVEVTVQVGRHAYKQRAWLSSLLDAGYAGDSSPTIRSAIANIKNN